MSCYARICSPVILALVSVCGGCGQPTPPTIDGTWSSQTDQTGFHVAEIQIPSSEFPCEGSVTTQFGGGQMFLMEVKWQQEGEELVGMQAEGDPIEIARVKLSGDSLSGNVTSLIAVGGQKELSFAGFTKQPAEEE